MPSDSPRPRSSACSAAEKICILADYNAAGSPIERGRPRDENQAEIDRLKRDKQKLKARAERAEDLVETLGKVHALLQNAVNKSATETQRLNERS